MCCYCMPRAVHNMDEKTLSDHVGAVWLGPLHALDILVRHSDLPDTRRYTLCIVSEAAQCRVHCALALHLRPAKRDCLS
jgi:hypothetical protein